MVAWRPAFPSERGRRCPRCQAWSVLVTARPTTGIAPTPDRTRSGHGGPAAKHGPAGRSPDRRTRERAQELVGLPGPHKRLAALAPTSRHRRIAAISSSTLTKLPRCRAWRARRSSRTPRDQVQPGHKGRGAGAAWVLAPPGSDHLELAGGELP